MLFTPWLEAVQKSLVLDRYRRRLRKKDTWKRGKRFRNMSNPIEVLEDRTLMSVQTFGGGTLPDPNPATGDVDPLSITTHLLPTDQSEHTVSLTFAENESPTADVVFIVDESGSMSDEHDWIGGMVTSLETSLAAEGITGNRYALVGYLEEGTLFSMTSEPITVSIYGPDGGLLQSQQLAIETTTGLIEGSFHTSGER